MPEQPPDHADLDTVLWLTEATRSTPPPDLVARIDTSVRRRTAVAARSDRPGRLLTAVALALAGAFLFQATGNIVAGQWISDGIGQPYAQHVFFEMSLTLIAAAVCATAAAVRRSWSGLSVLTCTPLALSLGLHGVTEFGVFAPGAILHTTEGVLGLLLAWAWWREKRRGSRDTRGRRREERA